MNKHTTTVDEDGIDGIADALVHVIVRPRLDQSGGFTIETEVSGLSKSDAARLLRSVADQFDREEATEEP